MNRYFESLSYKARKRWALAILVLGLPGYIVVAVTITSTMDRPSIWLELAIYIGLGVLWTYPFRAVFRGIGQEDPDKPDDPDRRD